MTEALRIIALQEAVSSVGEGAPSIELLARAQKFYDFLTADAKPATEAAPTAWLTNGERAMRVSGSLLPCVTTTYRESERPMYYVKLTADPICRTTELGHGILADLDAAGKVVGVEIL